MDAAGLSGTPMPDEALARQGVERTFKPQLARLDKTLALALDILRASGGVELSAGGKLNRKSVIVVMGLYAKALKTARSIRLVASVSLTDDGLALCRSLLETAVAIQYLLQKDTKLRSDEYLAHMLVRDRKNLEKRQKVRGLKGSVDKAAFARIDKALLRFNYLGPARLKELRTWYSGDPTIEGTFTRVGLQKLYHDFYIPLSGVQHVSDLPSHVELGKKEGVGLMMGSNDARKMRRLLYMANLILFATMERISQGIGLGYEATIARLHPNDTKADSIINAWKARQRARARTVTRP